MAKQITTATEIAPQKTANPFLHASTTKRGVEVPPAGIAGELTTFAMDVASVGNKTFSALADKKLSFGEIAELAFQSSLFSVINQGPQIVRKWNRVSDAEREEAITAFAAYFDIANDTAEAKIESTLKAAASLATQFDKALSTVRTLLTAFRKG
jgi:hypothetical protein